MFGVINEETRGAWQSIADNLSRQRPYAGRKVEVVAGRKRKGQRGVVICHMADRYVDAFRYGNEAGHAYTEMAGRYGFVCRVLFEDGREDWIKADRLACDHPYTHWSVALSDAILAG